MSLVDFAEKYLFEPLDIKDYSWYVNGNELTHSGGRLQLKPIDMAKIGQLFPDKGIYKGIQVVSPVWLEESSLINTERVGDDSKHIYYGYQWWKGFFYLPGKRIKTVSARGNGGQQINVFSDEQLVIVLTCGNVFKPDFLYLIRWGMEWVCYRAE